MKKLIKAILPYFIVTIYLDIKTKFKDSKEKKTEIERRKIHREKMTNFEQNQNLSGMYFDNINIESVYENSIKFLVEKGLKESHVLEGSIPLSSLQEIDNVLKKELFGKSYPVGLHIGNFLGVSLACLTYSIKNISNDNCLVISIDPNISHRNIDNPSKYCNEILFRNKLTKISLVLNGYSGEKSISNDGVTFENYDPTTNFNEEFAPENVIKNLTSLIPKRIDVVLIDGNHDADYLRNEVNDILPLLKNGSIIIFDDIDPIYWKNLFDVFTEFSLENYFSRLYANNRIAILKYEQ